MAEELTQKPDGYEAFIGEVKERIRSAQVKSALAVNRELVLLYWSIGRDILVRQAEQGWGARIIEQLPADLSRSFPGVMGFSLRNLRYMRSIAEACRPDPGSSTRFLRYMKNHHWKLTNFRRVLRSRKN